jgi:hypothetical protein
VLRGADDGARAIEARGFLFSAACHDIFVFFTPHTIWTKREVKDKEGLFTIRKKKKSLRGVSRMSTLVCCEFSRAKQDVSS